MQSPPIIFTEIPGQDANLGLITLNRPAALNALNHEMIILLHQKLLEWENASDIKAVVIQAVEGRAFCAGGDLRSIYEMHRSNDPSTPNFFRDEYRLNRYLFHYTKPYIALLDGITMGGGAGISLHGSHRLGTERLSFAMPETGIGFFPDIGSTYFLSRLAHGLGFYLGLTGARLSADDCLDLQLINYKTSSSNLPLIIKTLAETSFQGKAKETVSHVLQKFTQTAELPSLTAHYPFINQHFKKHAVEEILAALEADTSAWCQATASLLKKKSPTSLKVALRQLHEGVKRDFDQCMQLEYQLMCHFIKGHDFFEGIRAILIEKDQQPLWQPAELSELSQDDIEAYFLPLPGITAQLLFT